MENDKNNMYILAIVAIIAIVGLVVMISSASRAKVTTGTLSGDMAGQASRVARENIVAEEAKLEGYCGDGIINGMEQCDGYDLGGVQCTDINGFTGGTLLCDSNCMWDVSGCDSGYGVCGNDFREDPEECDGNDLGFKKTQVISLLLNRSQVVHFAGETYTITLIGLNQQDQTIIIRVNTETKTIEKYQNRVVGGLTLSLDRVYEDGAKVTLKANPYVCSDFGYAGGDLACASNCNFDTSDCITSNTTITSHYMEVYGNKNYNLNEIWRYTYNFGAYAYMATNREVEAYLSAQCSNFDWEQYKTVYAQASGKTSVPYWGGSIPEMNVNAYTANGINFESLTANCYSWGHIKETQEASNIFLDFNTEAKSYPSILGAGISKNIITNKYLVYFNATNYNGGICKIYYNIWDEDAHSSIFWETDLPNCPYNVDFWDVVPVNSTPGNMTRLWLSISLRPSLQSSNTIYTSGSGRYVFDAQARPLKMGGEELLLFESVNPSEKEQVQLMQKSNEFLLKVVKDNARK